MTGAKSAILEVDVAGGGGGEAVVHARAVAVAGAAAGAVRAVRAVRVVVGAKAKALKTQDYV